MNKEARLLRIGVLGCGPISQIAHFDACRKARNAELYAICDLAGDLLEKMAAIHDPRVTYSDLDKMLADPNVEAVIIGTADQFHVPLCRKVLATGRPVLVEKPLGVTIEECEELRNSFRKQELVLQIGHNRRFDPGIAFAKSFLETELGELIAFSLLVLRQHFSLYHDRQSSAAGSLELKGQAARRQSQGGQAPVFYADSRQPPGGHGSFPGR